MDNLEEFLQGSNEPEATEAAEAVEAPTEAAETTETAEARARDEKGRFAPKGETPAPEPESASPAPAEPQLDHPALIGERRRRQEAEDRLRALEEQLTRQPQQAEQPQGPPDRWEDPDGYDQWLVSQAANRAREEAREAYLVERIQVAAEEMKAQLPDYAEKIGVFQQMAAINPALGEEMRRAQNPAKYAYDVGKMQIEISQYGGIEKLIEARVAAATQPAPQAAPVPTTLADEQSARGGSAVTGVHVPTLDEILKR